MLTQLFEKKTRMVSPEAALPGRATPMPVPERHFVTQLPILMEVPEGLEEAIFAMGCFWGVERLFWSLPGVVSTMVGYAGGYTPNPSYEEVCTGQTGHTEVVRIIFDPELITYEALLRVFWENHDPTQGMRQGNDIGTQYRSAIFITTEAQQAAAEASRAAFQPRLTDLGYGAITTDIAKAPAFYLAEDYHQQYLAKNPDGYCGIKGTGASCPIGLAL